MQDHFPFLDHPLEIIGAPLRYDNGNYVGIIRVYPLVINQEL